MRRTTPLAAVAATCLLASVAAWAPATVPGASLAEAVVPAPAAARVEVLGKPLNTVSRALFGANLLWPYASAGSFDLRTDRFYPGFVAELERLGVSSLRYPGGTTADSFHWERAIGPRASRGANEPYGMQGANLGRVCCVVNGPTASTVGPDEFGRLLQQTGASGDVVVNFATGTVGEAAGFVAYMTAPLPRHPSRNPADPGYWAALRARNGHPAPYDVPYWEVGNEQLFPGQYGWRSGQLVSLAPNSPRCPAGEVATCLYAFGGTTRFSHQRVGWLASTMPSASVSSGRPAQRFYVYYPPVVPRSQTVMVDGRVWAPVRSFASYGPHARVYTFTPADGRLTFGDGHHGAVPPRGAVVTASYESGPHGGFVDFYRAMKHMAPRAHICETEETNTAFLRLMGRKYRYDCVELHEYAAPKVVNVPLSTYAQELMSYPAKEAAQLARLQAAIRRYSGRDVHVYVTEYGQLVWPVPTKAPEFLLSLGEALLNAAQVRQWALAGVPVAEKYLATSSPFVVGDPRRLSVDSVVRVIRREREGLADWDPALSIDSAMVAGPGPRFVAEANGLALGLMSSLGGERLVRSVVVGGPSLAGGAQPALVSLAALGRAAGHLVVINSSPSRAVRATVAGGPLRRGPTLQVSVLNGPGTGAYNTLAHPRTVRVVTRSVRVGDGRFAWTFPAHSVTLFRF